MKEVKITNAPIPNSGVEIGDIFKVKDYEFDPHVKYVLLQKLEGSKSVYTPESISFYKEDCQDLSLVKQLDVGLLIQKTQELIHDPEIQLAEKAEEVVQVVTCRGNDFKLKIILQRIVPCQEN